MDFLQLPSAHHAGGKHLSVKSGNIYEFNDSAVEISILNMRGKVLWRQKRPANNSTMSIVWNGTDLAGRPFEVGSYTCKIIYPNDCTVYLPFVYMR